MGNARPLSEAFLSQCPLPLSAEEAPALEQVLREGHARGASAWPGLVLGAEELARYLGRCCAADRSAEAERQSASARLRTLHMEDLYLCCLSVRGDASAQQALGERHFERLRGALHGFGRGPDFAADVLQELAVRLFAEHPSQLLHYRGTGELRGWLRACARRTAIDVLRRQPREERAAEVVEEIAAALHPEDEAALSELRAEVHAALQEACRTLPAERRHLLYLHLRRQVTQRELGRRLGLTQAAIASRVKRAGEEILGTLSRILTERHGLHHADVRDYLAAMRAHFELRISQLFPTESTQGVGS